VVVVVVVVRGIESVDVSGTVVVVVVVMAEW
jgi:hypothetical protein